MSVEPSRSCPFCGGEFRMAWIGNDPPEPFGEVCDCEDLNDMLREASEEKRADEAEFDPRDYGEDDSWIHDTDMEDRS